MFAGRLVEPIDRAAIDQAVRGLGIGIMSTRTGGTAALRASIERPDRVAPIVIRHG